MSRPPDRHMSPRALERLLGGWHRTGPAYTALADAVRAALLAGTLPLSTRLPSERELAVVLGLSRTTTSAAYQLLRDEGFLVSRRGSGTITTLPPSDLSAPGGATTGLPRAYPGFSRTPSDEIADLSLAAPPAPPSLHAGYLAALDALPRFLAGRGYEPMGVDVLREAVARRYRERGVPTTRDQILVTGGAQSALHLLLDALVGPGDRVVVEHPTYPHAITAIRAVGARPVPVPVGPDGTDLDLLESTIRQVSPRLVYLIPDYQNPTGTSLSDAGRARIREMAVRHRTVIIGDEALSDLTLDGAAPTPFAGGGTESGVVVSVGSASKAFWGGLRVGWMRAHPDLITRLSLTRAHVDLGTAVLEQLVTAHLLDRHDEILPERRSMLRERRDQVLALLAEQLPEWTVACPAGGLFLWADLGVPVSSALTALALRHGARLIPGPAFGVDGSFERFLRVPFTETPEVLTRGVRAVSASWSVLDPTATPATAYPTRAFV